MATILRCGAILWAFVVVGACSKSDTDYPLVPPGVDGGNRDGGQVDARHADARVDAPSADSTDLSIALAAVPNPVAANSTLTYTINVTNHGPNDAENVTVTDRLPDGNVQFQSVSGIGWTCIALGQIVTCTRPLVIVGAAPTITIAITTPSQFTTLVDTATVATDTTDTNSSNNSQMLPVTGATPLADLSITLDDSPDPVTPSTLAGCSNNDCVDYVVNVHNAGPATSTGLSVVFTLPIDGTFYSVIGSGWVCPAPVDGTITCTRSLSLVSGGDTPDIDLTWKAPSPGGYSIICGATVGSTSSDPTPANNSTSNDTTVFP